MTNKGNIVQSVDRALSVLKLLAERGESSVTDLAQELGVHKSTASRLLSTLAAEDFVEQVDGAGSFRLSFGVLHLASAMLAEIDIVRTARPILEALSETTAETVNIAVLHNDQVVNVDQVIGSMAVVGANWVGRRLPLHCTSTGKVLLAFLDEQERDIHLGRPLQAYTDATITDADTLRDELAAVRDQRYALTVEELEAGLNAVAAPVFDHAGAVIAAVSVSGPAYRFNVGRLLQLAEDVQRAAEEIGLRLGYNGP